MPRNNSQQSTAIQPTIRLISATPSAIGDTSASSITNLAIDATWAHASSPSALAPRTDSTPRRRLVPKKSRLTILGLADKPKERGTDLSDVVRRVGATDAASVRRGGGFEIYVDPTVDDDIDEIVVVKKKKSRAGLDGVRWGENGAALGEVTNVAKVKEEKEAPALTKLKNDESKWWSIGRGRKDSKEKRAKSPEPRDPYPRSKTPEPFKQTEPSRTRFNSLGANFLFSSAPISAPPPDPPESPEIEITSSYTRTRTQTGGAGPAFVPTVNQVPQHTNQGSIALRAMRSMRSLARIGSWAQLRGVDENALPGKEKRERRGTLKKEREKEKKVKKVDEEGGEVKKKKIKKKEKENEEGGEGKKKKKVKKKKEKEKEETETQTHERNATLRLSTSSFEIGSPTPTSKEKEKEKTKGLGKKKSILGLGLPSTMGRSMSMTMGKGMSMRLRSGSNASSVPSARAPSPSVPSARAPSPSLAPSPMPMPNVGAVHNGPTTTMRKLSADSAHLPSASASAPGRDRAGSIISTGSTTTSSLRPNSVISNVSAGSGGGGACGSRLSSGSSVRWDEDCLQSGRAARRREREERARERGKEGKEKENGEKERRIEGRKRTAIVDVFPVFGKGEMQTEKEEERMPIVTVEAASADGHSEAGEGELETPMRRPRRPVSDQLSGRSRPKPLYEGDDGVLSILDAATNDLAQLINHLDLEATPTPDITPDITRNLSKIALESPTENKSTGIRARARAATVSGNHMLSSGGGGPRDVPSVSSLRPYAQSRKNMSRGSVDQLRTIGKHIAPWPVLFEAVDTLKAGEVEASSTPPPKGKGKGREKSKERERGVETPRRTKGMKPATTPGPEPEPEPVFVPLRPAKSRGAIAALRAQFEAAATVAEPHPRKTEQGTGTGNRDSVFGVDEKRTGTGTVRAPSLRTFGSHSSSRGSKALSVLDTSLVSEFSPPPSPVFKRAVSPSSPMEVDDNDTVPIPPGARRILGMRGTMGGSDVSAFKVEIDGSDPDSDIPDELQEILSAGVEEDTMSYSGVGAEEVAMEIQDDAPTFRALLIDENAMNADVDVDAMSDEDGDVDVDNTKKSFDFTAEINKLNESGDRQSFVEQLENAFRTPAKVDLRYAFSGSVIGVEVPPVLKLPIHLVEAERDNSVVDMKDPALLHASMTAESDDERSHFDSFSGSQIAEVKEPTFLQSSNSSDEGHDIVMSDSEASPRSLKHTSSSISRPSNGQLNKAFKFGGLANAPPVPPLPQQDKPQTLSDIIPPPSHCRSSSNSSSSMMDEDDSLLKSIFAKPSADVARPRPRINSDSSVGRRSWENTQVHYRHSRHSSGISFAGFESYDEVRRGFEFSGDQSFYPPPTRRTVHRRQRDSQFSIASVSSYGNAHDYGLLDPFDYGQPSSRSRPPSENLSIAMSLTVDDTFSFIHRQPRKRVASDASSFYFKAPRPSSSRRESYQSGFPSAPPVSLFNRSFASHRRNDSASSGQSAAFSYSMHGGSGGRAILARHRRESSVDSVNSDFSAMRLGRPCIGDKMFEGMVDNTVMSDHVGPLSAISASPTESVSDQYRNTNRSSFEFDSIIDHERRSSTLDDSLFEKSGEKSSSTSESVFGRNGEDSQVSKGGLLEVPRYRPLSVLSVYTPNSPVREDDTMISMLGGGHVRRRSIDASPCARIEKRKHSEIQPPSFNVSSEYRESPNKARIVEKPSIASTSSSSFGGERIIKAKDLERESMEETVLIANGEDLQSSLHNIPVFSRPAPATRSRSSTCTSISGVSSGVSSGGDTPPLSACDDFSSMDEGSQSSIDLNQINAALANATHSLPTVPRHQVRARPRGHGHRRRACFAPAARSSVYETIEEERTPNKTSSLSQKDTPTPCQPPVFIAEPKKEVDLGQIWGDEIGLVTLRKYYALRDEAQTTVVESKRVWRDTPMSIFALQSFVPPRHPAGMQALLDHSVQNFGPLPSELRPRRARSRTSSRPSPYPQARVNKVIPPSPEKVRPTKNTPPLPTNPPVLQQVPINTNVVFTAPSSKGLKPSPLIAAIDPKQEKAVGLTHPRTHIGSLKPFSSLVADIEPKREKAVGLTSHPRPPVGSAVRRNALGSTKRNTGTAKTSTDLKENVGQGTLTTSGDSLRINRPRPRGRPALASTARPIRI